jgi:hypothetical protein
MAINPKINRYRDFMGLLPEGAFYDRDGIVVPYKDTPYEFRFTTDAPSTNFGVFLNGSFQGVVRSDVLGNVVVSAKLQLGENLLDVVQEGTQERTRSYLTARNYATWLAAYSDEFERVDDYIDETQLGLNLRTTFGSDLEAIWGARVGQSNNIAYDTETYREALQDLLLGYRLFGAKVKGHEIGVGAFCQVAPLDWYRKFTGKRWVLAFNFLDNGYFTERTHSVSPTPAIPGITLKKLSVLAAPGLASVSWNPAASSITYTDGTGGYVALVDRRRDGDYATAGAATQATFTGPAGAFFIAVGANELKFDIDGRGAVSILLPLGVQVAGAIVAAINAVLLADARYGLPYATAASVVGASVRLESQLIGPTASLTFYATPATPVVFTTTLALPHVVRGTQLPNPLYHAMHAGPLGPFNLTPANDTVELDIDRRGIISISLPNGPAITALAVAGAINLALIADPRYGLVYGATASGASGCVEIVSLLTVGQQDTNLVFHTSSGMLDVFGLGTPTKPLPFEVNGFDDKIAIFSVVNGLLPVAAATANFAVFQAPAPDGWFVTALAADVEVQLPRRNTLSFTTLRVSGDGITDVTLQHRVTEEAAAYKGFEFQVATWLRTSAAGIVAHIGRSFDNGASWLESVAIPIVPVANLLHDGAFIADTFIYDPDATGFDIRIRLTSAAAFDAWIDLVEVRQPEVTAAYLQHNTLPRSRHRSFFGHLLWAWCPDILSPVENEAIGLGTPPNLPVGHIDHIGAAHTQIDRFNVTEFNLITGKPINLKGIITEADWSAAALINLDIVPRLPDRFTHVVPSLAGIQKETIVFSVGLPPHLATVTRVSDQVPENTILFRDDTPIPRSYWVWIDGTTVRLDPAMFNTTSTYSIWYRALYQVESAPIDLGATWSDYVWFVDHYGFFRYSAREVELDAVTQLALNYGTFQAPLDRAAVPDTALCRLVRDDGNEVFELPQDGWSFSNPNTVAIDGTQVIAGALYTLYYKELGMVNERLVSVLVELRSAVTLAGLAAASYKTVGHNQAVKTHDGYRYHQLRVTLSNVDDTRDVRLSSVVLKGLNLFGALGTIPGLRG